MGIRVVTIGTFDTPHMGHATFLRKAAALGDELYVGVLTDGFVYKHKGALPYFTAYERAEQIEMLGWHVGVMHDHRRFILDMQADIIAVGSDWHEADYLERLQIAEDELSQLSLTIAYIPYTPGISTTLLKERLS